MAVVRKPTVFLVGAPPSEEKGYNENRTILPSASSLMIKRLGQNAEFKVLDSWRTREELLKQIEAAQPDHVALTIYDQDLESLKRFVSDVRRVSPKTRIDGGGPTATNNPLFCAYHLDLDSVWAGNAVAPYSKYLQIANSDVPEETKKEQLAAITSGFFRFGENREKFVGNRNPKSAWLTKREVNSEIDLEYLAKSVDEKAGELRLFTAFGCPARKTGKRCHFCSLSASAIVSMNGKRVAEVVRDAFEASSKGLIPKFKSVVFDDDDFLLDRRRTLEFLRYFKDFGLHKKMDLRFMTNPSSLLAEGKLDYELIDALHEANWTSVQFGTENFDERERYRLGKPIITNEQLESVISELDKRRIEQGHFNILTTPFSTLKDLQNNLENARELIKKYKTVRVMVPYTSVVALTGSDYGDNVAGKQLDADRNAFYFTQTPFGEVRHIKPFLMHSAEIAKFLEYHREKASALSKAGKKTLNRGIGHNRALPFTLGVLKQYAREQTKS